MVGTRHSSSNVPIEYLQLAKIRYQEALDKGCKYDYRVEENGRQNRRGIDLKTVFKSYFLINLRDSPRDCC